jgi:malate permease and related proteins
LETFLFAANAILPIVLLIVFGYFLKKIQFIDIHFINILNKYVFRVGLPVLLFFNVYNIENLQQINFGVVLFSVISILIMFVISYITVMLFVKNPKQKGVIIQAAIRSNFALIGVPLAQYLGGIEALAVVAILSAFTIPLANMLTVISLTMFEVDEFGERISYRKLLKNIISNPLIIGVMLGLIVLVLRQLFTNSEGVIFFSIKNDVPSIYETIRLISVTASPMALIALGGQFEISVIKPLLKQITLGVFLRNVFVPLIVLVIAVRLENIIYGMNYSYAALIALFASPVAVSSAIMAKEMNQDYELAGQIVIWSTVFSIFTLFFTIVVFKSMGAL